MNSWVDKIYSFNKELGLLEQGYDADREASFQIEEALEGFDEGIKEFGKKLGLYEKHYSNPKEFSRWLLMNVGSFDGSKIDAVDKHLDSIVFAFGSLFKLGLSKQQIHQAMNIVMDANMQKLNSKVDDNGKATKPKGFIPPEAQLQELLKDTL